MKRQLTYTSAVGLCLSLIAPFPLAHAIVPGNLPASCLPGRFWMSTDQNNPCHCPPASRCSNTGYSPSSDNCEDRTGQPRCPGGEELVRDCVVGSGHFPLPPDITETCCTPCPAGTQFIIEWPAYMQNMTAQERIVESIMLSSSFARQAGQWSDYTFRCERNYLITYPDNCPEPPPPPPPVDSGGGNNSGGDGPCCDAQGNPDPAGSYGPGGAGGYGWDSGRNSGGGGGGTKVLCTYYCWERGWLDAHTYEGDVVYALQRFDQTVMDGYHVWAVPLVKYIRQHKGSRRERLLWWFVQGWAYESAHRVGYREQGDWRGKALLAMARPVCAVLGTIIKAPDYRALWHKEQYAKSKVN